MTFHLESNLFCQLLSNAAQMINYPYYSSKEVFAQLVIVETQIHIVNHQAAHVLYAHSISLDHT